MVNYQNQGNKEKDLDKNKMNSLEKEDREIGQKETNFYEGVDEICTSVVRNLQDPENKIVIQGIAAESASGKGYLLDRIVDNLEKQDLPKENILVLSTDNYYKGISRMTMERIAQNYQMPELLESDKVQSLKNIIGNRYFNFKFGNGINEQGSEISDQAIMKDLYNRLFTDGPLDKSDMDRLEWALKEILPIPKEVLEKYHFNDSQKIKNTELAGILVSNEITEEKFSESFSQKGVMEQIKEALDLDPEKWESIQAEFTTDKLNFDEPEAVDLDQLKADLKKLKETGEITYPIYSMKVSEPIAEVEASQIKIALLEGIYALNDKIENELDEKAYLRTDRVHQLVRRFIRDVIVSKRTNYDPWLLLYIMTNCVFPGAQKYVVREQKKASLIIDNNLTETEDDLMRSKINEKTQIKYKLNKIQFNTLKKKLAALDPTPSIEDQVDFYVADGESNEHLLRVRVTNGELSSVQYQGKPKVSGQIISRAFINLCQNPIPGYLPYKNDKNNGGGAEKIIYDLANSGLHISNHVEKQRLVYELSDGVKINLDEVIGLKYFMEIRGENDTDEESIRDVIRQLDLKLDQNSIVDSYYDLKKADLNDGKVREDVEGSYEKIEITPEIKNAFKLLEKGYPDEPPENQTQGEEFRKAANVITSALVEKSLDLLESANPDIDKDKIVVALPWRSALAFAEAFVDSGITKFHHLSSKRNEATLQTEVTYESGDIPKDSYVVITDPMLATGNTIVDTIERVKNMGIAEDHILVVSVLAAPVGVYSILDKYSDLKILLGRLDKELNSVGYISPGLGDFGDKYFADLVANPEKVDNYTEDLFKKGILKEADLGPLQERFLGKNNNVINDSLNRIIDSGSQASISDKGEESESDSQRMLGKLTGEEMKVVQGYFVNHPELTFEETKKIVEDIVDHRGHELEIRFLIPKNDVQNKVEELPFNSISQSYFPKDQWEEILSKADLSLSNWQGTPLSTLRLREEKVDGQTKYILTAKSSKSVDGDGMESEKELDPELANRLLEKSQIEGVVKKERHHKKITVDGLELELQIDSFNQVGKEGEGNTDSSKYYYIVEIELPGDFVKKVLLENNFDSDYYLKGSSVKEITGKGEFSNYSLATKGFPAAL